MEIDRTIEGRERYTVNVRYPRGLRDSVQSLERVLVTTMNGAQVPLAQLGRFETVMGPPMIKSEAGSLVGWVFVDIEGRDLGGYVKAAKLAVADQLELPKGYRIVWTGQYEFLERVREKMQYVIPLTLLIVFGILYMNMGGVMQTLLVMSSVPFALVGSVWLLAALGYNTSIAVYVGMIALVGVAAETALVMVVYLDKAYSEWRAEGRLRTADDLIPMVVEAAALRIRPVSMMMLTNIAALIPIMLATGTGADVAKRIASPMWGGLISLTILTLFIVPVLYIVWRRWEGRSEWSEPAES
jgi:Cu(I)/Ag(I) efflux system membrane protein CusA/SilA